MTFELIPLLLTRDLGGKTCVIYDICGKSARSGKEKSGQKKHVFTLIFSSLNRNTGFYLASRIPPPPATSTRARLAGDIQVVDGVIETAKLGGPEPSFYSAPALVFRAGGGDVGVRITP